MAANEHPESNRVGAAYATVDEAERAIAALKRSGVEERVINLSHGAGNQDFGTGSTGTEDEAVAEQMFGSGVGGAAVATVVGAVIGAIIGAVAFGVFTPAWWGATLATGFAAGGLGMLWGLMTGFRSRGVSQAEPKVVDRVTVIVEASTPGEAEQARQVLQDSGGDMDADIRA